MKADRKTAQIFILFIIGLCLLGSGIVQAQLSPQRQTASAVAPSQAAPRLDRIVQQGVLRVGTTGDFKPFSFLNPATNDYEGHEIDAAKMLADSLGVKVQFINTTWPTLLKGIQEDQYDIAMCGITRNLTRQKVAALSHPYINVGKSPLIRAADQNRYKTLSEIDQPGVRIGVNPGGTNQRFVDANIKRATIIVIERNLSIPEKILAWEVDVMMTDNVEAMIVSKAEPRLYAVDPENTYTKDDFGYLMPRDDQNWIGYVNLWMDLAKLKGDFVRLQQKWIR